jgi:hypothetical protein
VTSHRVCKASLLAIGMHKHRRCDFASRPAEPHSWSWIPSEGGKPRLGQIDLQCLTSGHKFSQHMEKVTWPTGLQSLTLAKGSHRAPDISLKSPPAHNTRQSGWWPMATTTTGAANRGPFKGLLPLLPTFIQPYSTFNWCTGSVSYTM